MTCLDGSILDGSILDGWMILEVQVEVPAEK
jgi:hypothetical protein